MLSFFSTFNPANPTWDLFMILFFVIAVFLYGMTFGRARVVVQIVAMYMSMAVLAAAPFLTMLQEKSGLGHTLFYLLSFLLIFISLFLLLSKSAFHQQIREGKGGWFDVLVLSIFQVGLLASLVLSSFSVVTLDKLSPFTRLLFVGQPAEFVWVLLPVVALIAIRERK